MRRRRLDCKTIYTDFLVDTKHIYLPIISLFGV